MNPVGLFLPPPILPTIPPTPTPYPCNWAGFVTDVTIPDGTAMKPDREFKKTWRLKNIGSCTWSSDYDLVYLSGDRMDGDKAVPLDGTVRPGETVDVSVELTAPSDPDKYMGYWALRDAAGRVFGIGQAANSAFWVEIEVERPDKLAYDFIQHYCSADWRGGDGFLACPGDPEDDADFVIRAHNPVLEGGRQENEPGLWTQPQAKADAWITGEFPAFEVRRMLIDGRPFVQPAGDHGRSDEQQQDTGHVEERAQVQPDCALVEQVAGDRQRVAGKCAGRGRQIADRQPHFARLGRPSGDVAGQTRR